MNNDSSENADAESSKVESIYFQIAVLTLATFMAGLDGLIVSVSLPKIAGSLGSTPTEVIWIITGYIVAAAAILPISGWLATYFGRKNYYMASVVCFTATSLFCGLSTSIEALVFFRVLQGLAAGGLAASEQAIIADITPKEKLGRAFSIYAFAIFLAPVMGPTLGGFITDTFSWHWLFFINIPIGILSLFLTAIFVKESPQAAKAAREFRENKVAIDWLGIILFVSGIAAMQIVLYKGPREDWFESLPVLILSAYSFLALVIGTTWEYYHEKPAVDIFMFKNRGFAIAAIMIFLISFVTNGISFMIPLFAQDLLGYSAMDSGLISLPATIIQIIGIQVVGYYSDMFDIRRFIFFGLISLTLTMWYFSTMNLDAGFNDLVIGKMLQLFSMCFLGATLNANAYYGVPSDKNNSASALLNLSVTMGGSTGIAIVSTFIAVRTQSYVGNSSDWISSFNPNYIETLSKLTRSFLDMGLTFSQATAKAQQVILETVAREASMNAIRDTFTLFIFVFILLTPMVFLLKKKPF